MGPIEVSVVSRQWPASLGVLGALAVENFGLGLKAEGYLGRNVPHYDEIFPVDPGPRGLGTRNSFFRACLKEEPLRSGSAFSAISAVKYSGSVQCHRLMVAVTASDCHRAIAACHARARTPAETDWEDVRSLLEEA